MCVEGGVLPASLSPLRGWGPGVPTQGMREPRHGEAKSSQLAVPAPAPAPSLLLEGWFSAGLGVSGVGCTFCSCVFIPGGETGVKGSPGALQVCPCVWALSPVLPTPSRAVLPESPCPNLGSSLPGREPREQGSAPQTSLLLWGGGRRVLSAPGKGASPLLPEVGASQCGQQRGRGGLLHAPLLLRDPQSFQPRSHPCDHRADVSPA